MELLLADGTAVVYAHLQYIYVRPGEAVEAGQTLGKMCIRDRGTAQQHRVPEHQRSQPQGIRMLHAKGPVHLPGHRLFPDDTAQNADVPRWPGRSALPCRGSALSLIHIFTKPA